MDNYFILIDKYIAPTVLVFFGALLGYFFTNRIENKRQKNLYKSLYEEIERLNRPLKYYFPILLEQFTNPKQKEIKGTRPINLRLLEEIVIALMPTRFSLNNDQMDFIHNLRIVTLFFEKNQGDRDDEACNKVTQDNLYLLNPLKTHELIISCIDLIVLLDRFSTKKRKFSLLDHISFNHKYKKTCELSGIEYNEETYQNIFSQLPQTIKDDMTP
ncbi:hypothetical protein EBI01_12985 [Marinomonas rhizomae]|uniref:Uncharacterized protein n=1 Tax=Marinomonas rhizomae TaxID=491948 RepID=A0A366J234_9GAMM|nr:hypothetical protein [Marinomonas rhizomae]RBP81126.1 hypothetical protein DFP80_11096 [Marinomonas rhizomae]RNF72284.1 hypothetical protein EBI01_12985 [Marinomonas rhizomae]